MPDHDDAADGCELDFTQNPTSDEEAESLLVGEGEEEDEVDEEGEPRSPASPDPFIATRLRRGALILGAAGTPLFNVREVAGWKTRGRDFARPADFPTFNPGGSVNHHTAGASPAAGNSPSLGVCVHGRGEPNPLPGPLCHVLQAFDDTAIVIAAGVANHAGSGSWRGLTGNSRVYGLEVEHPGTSKVTQKRVIVMASIHACFLWRPTGTDLPVANVCQHREWSDQGKIDFATNFSTKAQADAFRTLVKKQLAKLNAVNLWAVSYLNTSRKRVTAKAKDPSVWAGKHKPAMQRGRVIFTPQRG